MMNRKFLTAITLFAVAACQPTSGYDRSIKPESPEYREAYQVLYSNCLYWSSRGAIDISATYKKHESIAFCTNDRERLYASLLAEAAKEKTNVEFQHNTARVAIRKIEATVFAELEEFL